jgi:hypothetical protein
VKILITVDTEEAWDWSGPYPTSNFSVEHINRIGEFQALCDRYSIRPTYFANHAVMVDSRASRIIFDLSRHKGVEIGMHVHPWATPPYRVGQTIVSRETYLHNASGSETNSVLEAVFQAHLNAGIRPTSFRGGRYSSSGNIQRFLQENDFVAESAVVPYTAWPEDGAPDYSRRDVYPKRLAPVQRNYSPLWEIPLSAGFTRGSFSMWANVYDFVGNSLLRHLKLIGLAEKLGIVRRVWLNFEQNNQYDWKVFISLLQRMNVPCITFTVHSSSLFIGPGPYTRTIEDERQMFEKIERVFKFLSESIDFEPSTVSAAALHLEACYQGRAG